MLKPLSFEPIDVTLPGDDDNPTVFMIRPLNASQRARITDLGVIVTEDGGVRRMEVHRAEQELETVKAGLVGWRNFVGSDGKPIPFSRGSTAIDHLRAEWIEYLAKRIDAMSTLSGDDEKN